MNFYYLYYSGCVERKGRGVYFKTIHYNTMTPEQSYKKAQLVLERMRDRKRAEKVKVYSKPSTLISEYNPQEYDITKCISTLKEAGYRIYKPINQYEEI